MILKTAAIVLSAVKYGDNSVILKCYTEREGVMTFIAGSLHSKKGPVKPSMIQPMSLLELVYYNKNKGELKRLKEAGWLQHYESLFYDPVKSSLAMFLAEFLGQVLREEESNTALFHFISESLLQLDEMESGLGNFHLQFMYRLTGFLGFSPERPLSGKLIFDLRDGVYLSSEPSHFYFLQGEEARCWQELHHSLQNKEHSLKLSAAQRGQLLDALITYYRLHVHDFGKLRSLEVLRELLS